MKFVATHAHVLVPDTHQDTRENALWIVVKKKKKGMKNTIFLTKQCTVCFSNFLSFCKGINNQSW